MNTNNNSQERIAIIGMAIRFPGADNCREYWRNLEAGKETISRYTEEELLAAGVPASLVKDRHYVRAKGALQDVWGFDAGFFGYSPREAALMDPQQRLFLECAWEALEEAGYDPGAYKGAIGVYAGSGAGRYLLNRDPGQETSIADRFQADIGNNPDFLSSRVAYKLNLTGPAMTVQTACSTSLVAVHQACQALQSGDCEMALAGGVSLGQLEKSGYLYQPGMIYSPDGRCRAFDAHAKGIVRGQGAGVVLLKRYEEAVNEGDHIYAVILSTALNNDGSDKIGYTAPSVEGQAKVIQQAHRKARISADSIGYVEAHGTGTLVGDPVEMEGLIKAFRASTDQKQFCAIGSVKTNMGHLDAAAGIAGLIKAALCLHHRKLVPSLHFEQPNPFIDFKNSPFYVNTETVAWKEGPWPRRAGISSYGIGGTNAHVLLEEAPKPKAQKAGEGGWQLLPLSARTPAALQVLAGRMVDYLRQRPLPALSDIAWTLQTGRRPFAYRWQAVGSNPEEAVRALQQIDTTALLPVKKEEPTPVVFMFQGQGAFYPDMGHRLYEALPVFRSTVDDCTAIVNRLFPEQSENVTVAQLLGWTNGKPCGELSLTALFILQFALARHFMSLGITPAAMIGYSSGEYVAACLAGIFSLEDALTLVTMRWQLITQTAPGKMIAIRLPEEEILALVKDHHLPLDIAGTTSPGSCVVSGSPAAIGNLEELLLEQGVKSHYLPIHYGAHSRLLEPIQETLRTKLASINIQPPRLPLIANVTGNWMQATEAVTPAYWVSHLRNTVRFAEGLDCLFAEERLQQAVFLEVGPGQVLSNLTRLHPGIRDTQTVLFTMDARVGEMQNELQDLYTVTGRLWQAGVDINWQALPGKKTKCRVPLPTYPFERQPHRVTVSPTQQQAMAFAPTAAPASAPAVTCGDGSLPDTLTAIVATTWKEALGQQVSIDEKSHFFRLGGDSLIGVKVLAELNRQLNTALHTGALVQYPEFGKLVRYIRQVVPTVATVKQPVGSAGIVQVLNEGQPGKLLPLVLVHPIGGDLYIYRDLVAALHKDQPVYAIQSPLLNSQLFTAVTIEAMAAAYLEALYLAGLSAPFVLGGASFGGVVAYEMARLLQQQKTTLPLLVQIDAPAVPANYTQDSAHILALLLGKRLPVTATEIRNAGDTPAQIAYVKELAAQRGSPELLPSRPELYINAHSTNWNALLQYRPSPYNGRVLFFHPLEAAPRTPLGWQRFWEPLAGTFESCAVAGNHITMNYQPNVAAMATVLQRAIEQQGRLKGVSDNALHE